MKPEIRLLVAISLAIFCLSPGAWAIEFGGGTSVYTQTDSYSKGGLEADSSSTTSYLAGKDSIIHKHYWEKSKSGNYAEVTFDSEGGDLSEYGFVVSIEKGINPLSVEQSLIISDAAVAQAKAKATNKAGDMAKTSLDVLDGSITDYTGKATATTSETLATQNIGEALGSSVRLKEDATYRGQESHVDTTVTQTNGFKANFKGSTEARAGSVTSALLDGRLFGVLRSSGTANTLTKTRDSNGQAVDCDFKMKAYTGSQAVESQATFYVDDDWGGSIQAALDTAWNGETVNVAEGAYSDDLDQSFYDKNVKLVGHDNPVTNSLTLNRPVGTGISGLTANTVNVHPTASILEGIGLTAQDGDVNVNGAAGYTYSDNLDQSFYARGITLNGFNNPVTNRISLNQPVAGKISGLTANTVTVNPGAKILQGIGLANTNGAVNVNGAAGYTYSDNLDQSFYARGITLNGFNNPVTNRISLNQPVAGKISGLTANTVNVLGPTASIQDGINLANGAGTGKVNVAAGTYNENLVVNKPITLAGAGNTESGTVIANPDTSKPVIAITTGGISATDRLVIKDLLTTSAGGSISGPMSYYTPGFLIMGTADISHITLKDVAFKQTDPGSGNYNNGIIIDSIGGSINDILISGAKISTAPTAWSGVSIGIEDYGYGHPISNIDIRKSTLGYGTDVDIKGLVTGVTVHNCNLLGHGPGVYNLGSDQVDARNNWWGSVNGPNTGGSTVSSNVLFTPWLTALAPGAPAP